MTHYHRQLIVTTLIFFTLYHDMFFPLYLQPNWIFSAWYPQQTNGQLFLQNDFSLNNSFLRFQLCGTKIFYKSPAELITKFTWTCFTPTHQPNISNWQRRLIVFFDECSTIHFELKKCLSDYVISMILITWIRIILSHQFIPIIT